MSGKDSGDASRPAGQGLCSAVLLRLIVAYQWLISPLLGQHCRFQPTCSAYARQAIERFGAARGGWLALRRLLRCHPFAAGGWDPVPERFSWREAAKTRH